jgi:F-type H+-transporting ATPase subunit delta
MPNRHVINEIIAAYANAALDGAYAAGGRDAVVEVRNQLIQILEFMSTNIKLRLSLDDEVYSPEQRSEIARNVFEGYNPILVELLVVMASRGDVEKLRRVYADYENLIISKLDFNVVDVTTVVDLDDNLRTVITNKIQADLGRDCVLVEHKDPSIMGGIVMSTMGNYIDASLRSQFDRARIVLKEKTDGGEC